MNEELLRALFKIPDPITVDEFSRRTGKTESAVRKLVERRLIPLTTEREVLGEEGSSRRLLILGMSGSKWSMTQRNSFLLSVKIGAITGLRKPRSWRKIWD